MAEFTIPYYLRQNGDGSASLQICQSLTDARNAEEDINENPEPFGDSSAELLHVKVEDNKIFFRDSHYVDQKFQWIWVEVFQGK